MRHVSGAPGGEPEGRCRFVRRNCRTGRDCQRRAVAAVVSVQIAARFQKGKSSHLDISLQYLVGVALLAHARLLDFAHPRHVRAKVARQRRVHGRVVDANKCLHARRIAKRDRHDGLGAHGVSDERRLAQVVLSEEALNVLGERGVVVTWVVWRSAVVAQILR